MFRMTGNDHRSSPGGEKLQAVLHLFGWATADQPHDPPQFFAYRVLLLRRDNNARMSAPQAHPALMQGAVIGRVVGEQRSSGGRGGGQMIFILAVDHVRFGSRQHVDVARP